MNFASCRDRALHLSSSANYEHLTRGSAAPCVRLRRTGRKDPMAKKQRKTSLLSVEKETSYTEQYAEGKA